jgi:hypothetical protein
MSPGDSSRATRDPTQPNRKENSGYLPESATQSNARDAIAATPAADLVRATIPHEINDAIQTELRIRAGALLKSGTPTDVVREALTDWATKTGIGPGTLPSMAADVIKRRNGAPNGIGKSTQKALQYRQLGRELIEEIHGEQP